MRVSVCRPSEHAKRQALNFTRDEEGLGETQEIFGDSEGGPIVFDEEFWAGFVAGLPVGIASLFAASGQFGASTKRRCHGHFVLAGGVRLWGCACAPRCVGWAELVLLTLVRLTMNDSV